MIQLERLDSFTMNNNKYDILFIDESTVTDGVVCQVYEFVDRIDKDLGIIHIEAGKCTPKQKIMNGTKTIEGLY